MHQHSSEKGQALIIITLAAVVLFAFAGLAIDGGMAFSDKRHAQNAADTAALAAALAKVKGQDYTAAAQSLAASNGYDNEASNIDVVVHNPPVDGPYAGNSEYIQVIVTSSVPTTFTRVLGRAEVTNTVETVVRAQGSVTGEPFFMGAGIATLKPNGEKAFEINGNATLEILKSGAFVNSNANCALHVNGNINMKVDTSYGVVGTFCKNGNVTVTGPVTKADPIPYPPQLNIPEPAITCTGNGYVSGNKAYPGTYNETLKFNGNGNFTMEPGNYCLKKGLDINGNVNVTANNINVNLTGETFLINGNTTFTCTNSIFFSNGGQGFRFNGNGNNNCTDVLFYAKTGEVLWNGNVSNKFKAPTSGPYKGLLIYMPYGNTTPLTINGNANNEIKGTILAVQAHINWNGNQGTEVLNSQVIGYTLKFNGNGKIKIDYDADENYSPPSSPTIELVE